jgi:PAS domain S-box-containing protein
MVRDKHAIPTDTHLSTGSVLAIDDDETSLGILRDLLEMSGLSVLTALEGQDGIDTFRKNPTDLVITDIRMPRIDGLEVLRRIREIDENIPVILVTGHGDLENALRALRRGAYDFLLKPINVEILLNTVRKGIDHCRLKRFERDYRLLLEEQVRARTKELAETNEFLKGILDSSTGVSIVLTDFDRKVLFWNTGAENIFGFTAEEMIGSSITKLYANNGFASAADESLRELLKDRRATLQRNVEQQAKDGRLLTISLTVSPMSDASNRIRGILGLGQDVTEQVRLHEELLRSYRRIRRIQGASIFALARLAESRDGETGFHLKRMQAYCKVLCDQLHKREKFLEILTEAYIEDLVQCSVLHDIGKVGIPDSVLFNPRKFGINEYEIMKQHSIMGGKALEDAAKEAGQKESYLFLARDIAYYHHERWDGSGYPFGLRGEDIPLAARIVALADVYDALTTERRYKRSYSHEEARAVIVEDRAKHFDPDVVDAFSEAEAEFKHIRDVVSERSRTEKF